MRVKGTIAKVTYRSENVVRAIVVTDTGRYLIGWVHMEFTHNVGDAVDLDIQSRVREKLFGGKLIYQHYLNVIHDK